MKDLMLIIILSVIIGSAALYVYKAKKRGDGCIGCPHSKACGGNSCNGSCNNSCSISKN